ncbi:MAG: helix-turn-helix domain-containing protein [Deltaproteobacteria bacterium]|jgi:DNA-binding transcriptional MerR regulator|nr:helix-turn-helix domain-containing protein [Deltaproteobacteria bacterium]
MQQTNFSLGDLATLTSYSKRTIRYYVQLGLVGRPNGEGRGAYYTTNHLRELLDIRKLTDSGLSLEAVGMHLRQESFGIRGVFARKPGAIQVQSRVCLAPGLDLLVSPDETTLTPEAIRSLVRNFLEITKRYCETPSAVQSPAGGQLPITTAAPSSRRGGETVLPSGSHPSGSRRN